MLSRSRYPAFLKRRIGGRWGHLENQAAPRPWRSSHPGLRRWRPT
jgi:hypothetical protein